MQFRRLLLATMLLANAGRALAGPYLGANMDEFHSTWGRPSHQEILVRTATLRWKGEHSRVKSPVPGAFAVEVAFLDKTACEMVVRSNGPRTSSAIARLIRPLLQRFRADDFARAASNVNGIQIYKLTDGTSVSVKQHQGHTVVVMKGECFMQNEDIFDREAAKVRPPTSNH